MRRSCGAVRVPRAWWDTIMLLCSAGYQASACRHQSSTADTYKHGQCSSYQSENIHCTALMFAVQLKSRHVCARLRGAVRLRRPAAAPPAAARPPHLSPSTAARQTRRLPPASSRGSRSTPPLPHPQLQATPLRHQRQRSRATRSSAWRWQLRRCCRGWCRSWRARWQCPARCHRGRRPAARAQ